MPGKLLLLLSKDLPITKFVFELEGCFELFILHATLSLCETNSTSWLSMLQRHFASFSLCLEWKRNPPRQKIELYSHLHSLGYSKALWFDFNVSWVRPILSIFDKSDSYSSTDCYCFLKLNLNFDDLWW